MNSSNEKKLEARATALGNSACPDAFGELVELAGSESPLVRRLAASALGKLSGMVSAEPAVRVLHPLLQDAHPQVRQYSAKTHLNRRIQNKEFRISNPAEPEPRMNTNRREFFSREIKNLLVATLVKIRVDSWLKYCVNMIKFRKLGIKSFSGGVCLRDSTFLVLCSSFAVGQTCLDRGALYPKDKPRMREILLEKLEKLK